MPGGAPGGSAVAPPHGLPGTEGCLSDPVFYGDPRKDTALLADGCVRDRGAASRQPDRTPEPSAHRPGRGQCPLPPDVSRRRVSRHVAEATETAFGRGWAGAASPGACLQRSQLATIVSCIRALRLRQGRARGTWARVRVAVFGVSGTAPDASTTDDSFKPLMRSAHRCSLP
jgi:hypothetical protein